MIGHYRVVQVVCLHPLIVGDKKAPSTNLQNTKKKPNKHNPPG